MKSAPAPSTARLPSWQSRLRKAERLVRTAAGLGRLGAWSVNLENMHLTWSDEVCAIHGVPAGYACSVEEAINFYAPGSREAITRAFESCAREGTPYDLELQIVTAQKETLWVRAIGEAERDAQGRIVGVQGAFQDISRLRRETERTRELAERLTMTLESMTEAFFTVDREWRMTYINRRMAELLQRDRAELLGCVVWEEFPEAVDSVFHREYERALADNVTVEFEAEYAPLALWLQVRAYPSPQGLAVSLTDVTERVRARDELLALNVGLEERVKQRTAELELANREMETFSYSVAHDLRAPLAAINGYSHVLCESEASRLSQRGEAYLKRILASAVRMDRMTDALLALARLSRSALKREFADMAPLAERIVADMREREPHRCVTLEVERDLWVEADQVLLAQVMENLLGNAWKFTSRAPNATIRVGMRVQQDGEPVYFVADDGAGFDSASASKLFLPFHRLHTEAEFSGTGIGLATVHKIVSRHGGRIWAESEPGKGATFYFTMGPIAAC